MSKTFKTKKRLGQNFLASARIIEEIIEGSGAGENDLVIEIGPGMGALTEPLAKRVRKVTAVEIDEELIPILRSKFALARNVRIIEADILETDLAALIKEEREEDPGIDEVRVIGNLPYYITTPIIMKLLEEDIPVAGITIMMQKEVAERILAAPGGKDYGALTLAVGYRCTVTEVCDAPAEDFRPQPKVDSKVLRLELRDEKATCPKDEKMFFECIRNGFAQRRKTLANCLAPLAGGSKQEAAAVLESAGIDPKRRAETLSMEEFTAISDAFSR